MPTTDVRPSHIPLAIPAFLLAASLGARAVEPIRISATRKTAHSHRGEHQSLPGGDTRYTEKSVYYEVELRPLSMDVPGSALVEWVILLEQAGGKLRAAARGKEPVSLQFGKSVSFDTDPVKLESREWRREWGAGKLEDSIHGYAIRVLDRDSGAVIAEKYQPASVQDDVQWIEERHERTREKLLEPFKKRRRPAGRPPAPRGTRPGSLQP